VTELGTSQETRDSLRTLLSPPLRQPRGIDRPPEGCTPAIHPRFSSLPIRVLFAEPTPSKPHLIPSRLPTSGRFACVRPSCLPSLGRSVCSRWAPVFFLFAYVRPCFCLRQAPVFALVGPPPSALAGPPVCPCWAPCVCPCWAPVSVSFAYVRPCFACVGPPFPSRLPSSGPCFRPLSSESSVGTAVR
jgi:hypothetical protein